METNGLIGFWTRKNIAFDLSAPLYVFFIINVSARRYNNVYKCLHCCCGQASGLKFVYFCESVSGIISAIAQNLC